MNRSNLVDAMTDAFILEEMHLQIAIKTHQHNIPHFIQNLQLEILVKKLCV